MKPFQVLKGFNALLDEGIELPGKRGRAPSERFGSKQAVAARLGRTVAGQPEAFSKMLAKIYTPGQAASAIDYITRDGGIKALIEAGLELRDREEIHAALETWRLKDDPALPHYDPLASRNARLAIHMTLSMSVGVDKHKVLEAGRRFCLEEFGSDFRPGANRPYFLVLHTPENEPDPAKHKSKHPHVHIIVKARNDRGERMRTDQPDLDRFREVFAWHLRAQGVAANATSRLERGLITRGFHTSKKTPGRRPNTMAAYALQQKPEKSTVLKAIAEDARNGRFRPASPAEQRIKAQGAIARQELAQALALVTQGDEAAQQRARQFLADLPPLRTNREALIERHQPPQLVR